MGGKYRKDGTLSPSADPSVPHPGMVFHWGRWSTPKAIERKKVLGALYRATHKEELRAYELANKEKIRALKAAWRAAHPGYSTAWATSNREKMKAYKAAWRAKKMAAGLCSSCGKFPLATKSSWSCNSCLDAQVSPKNRLKSRRRSALRARQQRRTRTDG